MRLNKLKSVLIILKICILIFMSYGLYCLIFDVQLSNNNLYLFLTLLYCESGCQKEIDKIK